MDVREWEPIYEAIRADFGFDRRADTSARDRLYDLTTPWPEDALEPLNGATVLVIGAGPSLEEELPPAPDVEAVVATTAGAHALASRGDRPAVVVTDLDTDPDLVVAFSRAGTPVAVHGHGDNRERIESVVPRCRARSVCPTTQVEPRGHVRMVGGFTDGDRAAYLADAAGAAELRFAGWDLADQTVGETKRRKLEWARWLLERLETDRGEHYGFLDGHRGEGPPVRVD